MPTPANPTALAQQARRSYVEGLLSGLPGVVQAVDQGARILVSQVVEPQLALKRRELVPDLQKLAPYWLQGMTSMLRGTCTRVGWRRTGLSDRFENRLTRPVWALALSTREPRP